MMKEDYVPLGGFMECAETYWSRYVPHYLLRGSFLDRRQLCEIVSAEELTLLLPDYESESVLDGRVMIYRKAE